MNRVGIARALSALVGVAALLVSGPARATQEFPGVIASTWGLPAAPPCTTCHLTLAGGSGTAQKPFALYLKSRGLRPFDPASLQTALAAARAERHDTDGNGRTDEEDLRAGDDPNGDGESVEQPRFGCGARVAARGPAREGGLLAAATGFALALVRRRARRPHPEAS